MSFKKIQIIDPKTINPPEAGNIYLGQDSNGLWEMDSTGKWWYIGFGTGNTTIINNYYSGITSGSSGISGSSGKDGFGSSGTSGGFGSSGTSGVGSNGTSGFNGTSGVNGTGGTSGTNGTSSTSGSSGTSSVSGTSGTNGTSSTSGTSGTSSTSGTSGSSSTSGTSGTSGSSGINGGYGGGTRRWILDYSSVTPAIGKVYILTTSNQIDLINYLNINIIDSDGALVDWWLNTWMNWVNSGNSGVLKIEDRRDLSVVGMFSVNSTSTIVKIGNFYKIQGMIPIVANGLLVNGNEYLLSFMHDSGTSGINGTSGLGTNGTSGTNGTNGTSSTSGTSGISYDIEKLNFNVFVSGETSIYLDDYAWYAYEVSGLTLRTPYGTCYVDMMISGNQIYGMDSITGTTSMNIYYSTSNSIVNIGDNLYLNIIDNVDSQYLIASIKIRRI